MKCSKWSLGGDVGTDPPLLADMGLSILQDEEEMTGPTPTPPATEVNTSNPPPAPKVRITATMQTHWKCLIYVSLLYRMQYIISDSYLRVRITNIFIICIHCCIC